MFKQSPKEKEKRPKSTLLNTSKNDLTITKDIVLNRTIYRDKIHEPPTSIWNKDFDDDKGYQPQAVADLWSFDVLSIIGIGLFLWSLFESLYST